MPGGRPHLYKPEKAAGHPVVGACRFPAQGYGRTWHQRPPAAALRRPFRPDWRIACGNCGNPSPSTAAEWSADWHSACGNCGNGGKAKPSTQKAHPAAMRHRR